MSEKVSAARRTALLRNHWPAESSDLRRQRLARRMSLQDVADTAGVARSTVARAEASHPISSASWDKIATALAVPRETIDREFREQIRAATGFELLPLDGC